MGTELMQDDLDGIEIPEETDTASSPAPAAAVPAVAGANEVELRADAMPLSLGDLSSDTSGIIEKVGADYLGFFHERASNSAEIESIIPNPACGHAYLSFAGDIIDAKGCTYQVLREELSFTRRDQNGVVEASFKPQDRGSDLRETYTTLTIVWLGDVAYPVLANVDTAKTNMVTDFAAAMRRASDPAWITEGTDEVKTYKAALVKLIPTERLRVACKLLTSSKRAKSSGFEYVIAKGVPSLPSPNQARLLSEAFKPGSNSPLQIGLANANTAYQRRCEFIRDLADGK